MTWLICVFRSCSCESLCSMCSLSIRVLSRGHCVDDDVGREARVVCHHEALVAKVVVPLAAVILVAVQHGNAPVDLDSLQVFVHEAVAPPVKLLCGARRPIEFEERVVNP